MKKLIFTTLMTVLVSSVWAQEVIEEIKPKKMKTLAGSSGRVTGFGALELRVTEIKNDLALMPGVSGGLIFDHNFILGLGGYGLATEIGFTGLLPNDRLYLYGGYGGLILGGIIAPNEVIHINIPVLIGAGGAYISENGFDDDFNENDFDESSAFFVVEPGIELEINVTNFFRIGIGGSYRWVKESDLVNISDSDLTNYSGHFALKFGKF